MNPPVITLLTDFGTSDHYVAAMKGVILSICPGAQLVDITHEIRPYSILGGAFSLSQAWRYFPAGTVHLVVVDPGVGSSRRPIVGEAEGHRFVAPDNGVLSMIGPIRAHEIAQERFFRKPVSRTFHGRDIFAPVAAHLAAGVAASDVGPEVSDPVCLPDLDPVETGPGVSEGLVLRIDRYGNVVTNFQADPEHSVLRIGSRIVSQHHPSYAYARSGEAFLLKGSSGYIEISINQGNAAVALGLAEGARITLKRNT